MWPLGRQARNECEACASSVLLPAFVMSTERVEFLRIETLTALEAFANAIGIDAVLLEPALHAGLSAEAADHTFHEVGTA